MRKLISAKIASLELIQNFIKKIVCPENQFFDAFKAVLKEIISEGMSSNFDADDDATNVSGFAKNCNSYGRQQ